MKKYHYDLRRHRVQPATAGSVETWTARTTFIHHLPRLSVFAPPHPPLGTQNEVPIAMCMKLSRCAEGKADISVTLSGGPEFMPRCLTHLVLPEMPFLLFRTFLGQIRRLDQKISFKIFSRFRRPCSMDCLTLLSLTFSALAMELLLIPRK